MVNKRSTTGISANLVTETDTVVEAGDPKEVGDEAQPELADTEALAEVGAESEAESISMTTAELVKDNGECYTDHPNFDKLLLDETVKSNSSFVPFYKRVDQILLFALKKSSSWTSRGAPAKPTL